MPSNAVVPTSNSQPTYSYDDPFAPKPPPAVSASDQILGVYGNIAAPTPAPQPQQKAPPVPAAPSNYYQGPPAAPAFSQPNYGYSAAPTQPAPPVPTQPAPPVPTQPMATAPGGNLYVDTNYQEPVEYAPAPAMIVNAPAPAQADDTDEISKKMASLVNLTDLNSPAGNSTYNPFDLSSGASVSSSKNTSGHIGPAPSLQEMSKTSVKANQNKGPVMKAPPTGAMVMHQQQQQGYGGYNNYAAPPIQQTGFGAGVQPQQPMMSPTYQYGQQQPPMSGQQPMTSPTYSYGQQQQSQGFAQQPPHYPQQQF